MSKKCKHCADLDEMEFECPEDPHHGAVFVCEECEGDYYEEYGGNYLACNEQAKINHPNLKTL